MWKNSKYCCAVMGLIIFFLGGTVSATGYKATELNRKMAEISSLQHRLSEKIALATDKKQQLEAKAEDLKNEIKHKNQQLEIASYHKAIMVPRIEYNLRLIQLLNGYTARLTEKIIYFQNGYDTLDFYLQQAQDDLLMIKTLNDLEVDKLIAQINSALDEYTPETTRPLFDVDGVPLKDTEEIWNEIVHEYLRQ
jgi:hypothetical protein